MKFIAKPVGFLVCSLPLLWLSWYLYLYFGGDAFAFGADPGKEIVHFLGQWTLIALLATLAITPLQGGVRYARSWSKYLSQSLSGFNFVHYRRMLGLFAFSYGVLHLFAYCVFLLGLDFSVLSEDVIERPFITVGAAALLGMLALAVTSTNGMQRRLGKTWKKLHQLIYPISFLAIIHLFWQTRSDFTESLLYSAALALLMSYRVFRSKRIRKFFESPQGT